MVWTDESSVVTSLRYKSGEKRAMEVLLVDDTDVVRSSIRRFIHSGHMSAVLHPPVSS